MGDRLFDRNNYSTKTIENFEIMSAYYVDIFYNHLYIEAKKLKTNGRVVSITEGYKHTLNAFLKGLSNPKLYKKSIVGLHHYYISIGFASISFAKCVDRLTKEFVPTDYFNSLTVTQKMGVLRMVLNQSLKTFIRKLVDEHMAKIIDYHTEADNTRLLQDDMIDCLIMEREGIYQRFVSESTRTNKNENVNRLIAEKMQIEIKRLVGEKYAQKKQIIALKRIIMKKSVDDRKTTDLVASLKKQITILNEQKSTEFIQLNHTSDVMDLSGSMIVTDCGEKHQTLDTITEHSGSSNKKTNTVEKKIDSYNEPTQQIIEVNTNNIQHIIQGDSDDLCMLNDRVELGTTLEDF
jgi:hypothetical protein